MAKFGLAKSKLLVVVTQARYLRFWLSPTRQQCVQPDLRDRFSLEGIGGFVSCWLTPRRRLTQVLECDTKLHE